MGTNYYCSQGKACPKCGRGHGGLLHVGKSSGGWEFIFQAHREPLVTSYADWRPLLEGGSIENEYGEVVTFPEFLDGVEAKRGQRIELSAGFYLDPEGYPFCREEFS